MKTKKQSILSLALNITKKNLQKGNVYKPKTKYADNKKPRPKLNSKKKVYKTAAGMSFHVRDNMSGKAFKNLLDKKSNDIKEFNESSEQILL